MTSRLVREIRETIREVICEASDSSLTAAEQRVVTVLSVYGPLVVSELIRKILWIPRERIVTAIQDLKKRGTVEVNRDVVSLRKSSLQADELLDEPTKVPLSGSRGPKRTSDDLEDEPPELPKDKSSSKKFKTVPRQVLTSVENNVANDLVSFIDARGSFPVRDVKFLKGIVRDLSDDSVLNLIGTVIRRGYVSSQRGFLVSTDAVEEVQSVHGKSVLFYLATHGPVPLSHVVRNVTELEIVKEMLEKGHVVISRPSPESEFFVSFPRQIRHEDRVREWSDVFGSLLRQFVRELEGSERSWVSKKKTYLMKRVPQTRTKILRIFQDHGPMSVVKLKTEFIPDVPVWTVRESLKFLVNAGKVVSLGKTRESRVGSDETRTITIWGLPDQITEDSSQEPTEEKILQILADNGPMLASKIWSDSFPNSSIKTISKILRELFLTRKVQKFDTLIDIGKSPFTISTWGLPDQERPSGLETKIDLRSRIEK